MTQAPPLRPRSTCDPALRMIREVEPLLGRQRFLLLNHGARTVELFDLNFAFDGSGPDEGDLQTIRTAAERHSVRLFTSIDQTDGWTDPGEDETRSAIETYRRAGLKPVAIGGSWYAERPLDGSPSFLRTLLDPSGPARPNRRSLPTVFLQKMAARRIDRQATPDIHQPQGARHAPAHH